MNRVTFMAALGRGFGPLLMGPKPPEQQVVKSAPVEKHSSAKATFAGEVGRACAARLAEQGEDSSVRNRLKAQRRRARKGK